MEHGAGIAGWGGYGKISMSDGVAGEEQARVKRLPNMQKGVGFGGQDADPSVPWVVVLMATMPSTWAGVPFDLQNPNPHVAEHPLGFSHAAALQHVSSGDFKVLVKIQNLWGWCHWVRWGEVVGRGGSASSIPLRCSGMWGVLGSSEGGSTMLHRRRGWELGMRTVTQGEREGSLVPNPEWEMKKSEEKSGKGWEAMQKGHGVCGRGKLFTCWGASWSSCDLPTA